MKFIFTFGDHEIVSNTFICYKHALLYSIKLVSYEYCYGMYVYFNHDN